MKRKQFNLRIPQSHINRINEMRLEDTLSQAEFVMRLVDEEWTRRNQMKALACRSGEDIWQAVERGIRDGHFPAGSSTSSNLRVTSKSKPQNAVGTVSPRAGERFWVIAS